MVGYLQQSQPGGHLFSFKAHLHFYFVFLVILSAWRKWEEAKVVRGPGGQSGAFILEAYPPPNTSPRFFPPTLSFPSPSSPAHPQPDPNKPANSLVETLLLLETAGNHKNTDFVQRRPRLPVKVTLGTPERSFVPRPLLGAPVLLMRERFYILGTHQQPLFGFSDALEPWMSTRSSRLCHDMPVIPASTKTKKKSKKNWLVGNGSLSRRLNVSETRVGIQRLFSTFSHLDCLQN